MNDDKWFQFFDLLKQVVHDTPGSGWKEKRDEVLENADIDGSDEANLRELASWFSE